MPTLEHNGLIEMFRENPDLAPRLLATLLDMAIPPYATVGVVESSLDQMIPVEFRADLVLELRDAQGVLVLAIILEVQRDQDPDKTFSWPVYVAVVRAKKRCPAIVLVIAPDDAVATWAAQPIDLGLGRGTLRPLVLGPAIVPEVTDPVVAERETELAVLSAVAHGNGPRGLAVVQAALGALGRLDQEHAAVYFQIIYNALREPMQKALEALVMERQTEGKATPFPPFAQKLIERGRLDGLREGKLDGLRGGASWTASGRASWTASATRAPQAPRARQHHADRRRPRAHRGVHGRAHAGSMDRERPRREDRRRRARLRRAPSPTVGSQASVRIVRHAIPVRARRVVAAHAVGAVAVAAARLHVTAVEPAGQVPAHLAVARRRGALGDAAAAPREQGSRLRPWGRWPGRLAPRRAPGSGSGRRCTPRGGRCPSGRRRWRPRSGRSRRGRGRTSRGRRGRSRASRRGSRPGRRTAPRPRRRCPRRRAGRRGSAGSSSRSRTRRAPAFRRRRGGERVERECS